MPRYTREAMVEGAQMFIAAWHNKEEEKDASRNRGDYSGVNATRVLG